MTDLRKALTHEVTPEVTPEVTVDVDETAKREWVGITEDEAKELYEYSATEWQFVQAIEARLKEKNNG